jgi:predicted protein tyrosine phosphatase
MSGEVRVEVASVGEASQILSSAEECAALDLLISIGETGDALPEGFTKVDVRLRLTFPDTTDEHGPTESDVGRIIEAAEMLAERGGRVLAHCAAGVSRSSAAALIIYAVVLGQGREEEAMQRVLAQRPIARPNRRMIDIADRLLQRHGALLETVDRPV